MLGFDVVAEPREVRRRVGYVFGGDMGVLIVFCGVNVAISVLPPWMQTVASVLPLTHGIEAARSVVAGASLGSMAPLVLDELLIGFGYAGLGLALLLYLERSSRRHATLELA